MLFFWRLLSFPLVSLFFSFFFFLSFYFFVIGESLLFFFGNFFSFLLFVSLFSLFPFLSCCLLSFFLFGIYRSFRLELFRIFFLKVATKRIGNFYPLVSTQKSPGMHLSEITCFSARPLRKLPQAISSTS